MRRPDPLDLAITQWVDQVSAASGRPDRDTAAAAASTDQERHELRELQALGDLARAAPQADGPLGNATAATAAPRTWGRYVIRDLLATSTFSDVYRAWDVHLEREVALKLLKDRPHHRGDTVVGLRKDAALAARVVHRNVVTVHDADVHDGRPGICMELIVGSTLADIVQRQGTFSLEEAASIGLTLCRAVAAVHAVGVIHRDIKAQNVMRERGGRIVLMDFGAASVDDPRALAGASGYGTPLYTAPEVLEGQPAARTSDVYSLGVLLHFLVTGSVPVQAKTFAELRDAHAGGANRRLTDDRLNLAPELAAIVEKALAPASLRFRTATELEVALSQYLRTAVIGSQRPRRNHAAAFAGLVAVAAGLYAGARATNVPMGLAAAIPVAAPSSLAPVTVPVGAAWRYRKGSSPPPAGWNNLGFDDSEWAVGPTPIGYGENDLKTVLEDMRQGYWSVYARAGFHVRRPLGVSRMTLRLDYDDGYVAYLNGVEVSRAQMGSRPPAFDTPAALPREAGTPVDIDLSDFKRGLVTGDNVLAIEVHNQELRSSDLMLAPWFEVQYAQEPGCGVVDAVETPWQRLEFDGRAGTFTADVHIAPHELADAGVSLSQGPQSRHGRLAATVRFSRSGVVEAGDGPSYRASTFRYRPGAQYHLRLTVDVRAQQYDVYIAERGQSQVLLASALRFRTTVSHLDHWTLWADREGMSYCDPRVR